MVATIELRVLELLCARLCHELVSPVGAVNNGVELLEDEEAGLGRDAIALIGQSGRKAARRLQFYRFAYGGDAVGDGSVVADLAQGLFEGGKVGCVWPKDANRLAHAWQRLACNMLVLGAESLPRGGQVTLRLIGEGGGGLEVRAAGEALKLTGERRAALAANSAEALTTRTIQAYFTQQMARRMGAELAIAEAGPLACLITALSH
ncbi:MAG TPA: histidine phosphotransferase family protein [Stellaceae bacterium]|nr:histidine phosphotransferase family protein [Stellaceae bacterium]